MSAPCNKQEVDAVNEVKMSASSNKEELGASSDKDVHDAECQYIPSKEELDRAGKRKEVLENHSHKALVYLEEGEFTSVLKEATKCLVKGYMLKGTAELKLGAYQKALTTFQEGLQHDEDSNELLDGIGFAEALKKKQELQVRSSILMGEKSESGTVFVVEPCDSSCIQAKAEMNTTLGPILSDPIMLQILIDRHESLNDVQQEKSPLVEETLQKLEEAGLLDDIWY